MIQFLAERLVYGDISLECVDKFCYLGDMINAGGGVEAVVTARIRSGWRKCRELLPLLTSKGTSLRLKGKTLYSLCSKCDVVRQRNIGDQKGG